MIHIIFCKEIMGRRVIYFYFNILEAQIWSREFNLYNFIDLLNYLFTYFFISEFVPIHTPYQLVAVMHKMLFAIKHHVEEESWIWKYVDESAKERPEISHEKES